MEHLERREHPPLTQEKFLDILKYEGMRYEPSPYDVTQFSEHVDTSLSHGFDSVFESYLEIGVSISRAYLSSAIISDNFMSHTDRRAWRNSMTTKFGKDFNTFYERNRIKANSVGSLYTVFTSLFDILDTAKDSLSPQQRELREVFTHIPDLSNYAEKTNEERYELTEKMDQVALQFLSLVLLQHA